MDTVQRYTVSFVCTETGLLSVTSDQGGQWVRFEDHFDTMRSALAESKGEIGLLRKALIGILGTDDAKHLKEMELMMRQAVAPEEDKAATINAIHALLKTAPQT